jgi:hypothetical protein
MAQQAATKKTRTRERRAVVTGFDMVGLDDEDAKAVYPPQTEIWRQLIHECVTTGRAAVIRDFNGRDARNIMSSIAGFAKRNPGLTRGKSIRTRLNQSGKVVIFASDEPGRAPRSQSKPEAEATTASPPQSQDVPFPQQDLLANSATRK